MAEPTEVEIIEARLAELKIHIQKLETEVSEAWIRMIDLRARRAAIRQIEQENGDGE